MLEKWRISFAAPKCSKILVEYVTAAKLVNSDGKLFQHALSTILAFHLLRRLF